MRSTCSTLLGKLEIGKARWIVHALIVGTVLITACGWVGGGTPTPTVAPASPIAAPTPSPPPPSPPSVPTPSPSPSPSPSPAAGESYTVADGDTLATIAERFYGDPTLWRPIYEANRTAIGDNPDNVRVGTTLRIPPKP
jgi:nucleoid-associated protein YgaU